MAEDSSRRLWKIKQLLHRFASGFEGEVATGDVLRINHNAAATQRLNVTLQAVVTQREVHVDVPSFAEALRRALRQDPDIILVGELRDLETMEAAIAAAETGHLVFGTLHTTGAAKTIDRLVNAFPVTQQEQIRIQLSTVLQAVISQLLIPRCDKPGRVAVFEILVNTPSIAALIRDNKTFRIGSDI